MAAVLAVRQAIHGPLWTVEQGRTRLQLWGPNDGREHWAIGWTTLDADDEVIDSGHERAGEFGAIPALVPRRVARLAAAAINAASSWDPGEACDHSRARSFGVVGDGRRRCGYCGRTFDESQRREVMSSG